MVVQVAVVYKSHSKGKKGGGRAECQTIYGAVECAEAPGRLHNNKPASPATLACFAAAVLSSQIGVWLGQGGDDGVRPVQERGRRGGAEAPNLKLACFL